MIIFKRILSLISFLSINSANAAVEPKHPYVLNWNVSIAAQSKNKLLTISPGTVIHLNDGKTNTAFEILGEKIPDTEQEHRAVKIEFQFRFLKEGTELSHKSAYVDQHSNFIPVKPVIPPHPAIKPTPASMELSSIDSVTIPSETDSFEIVRIVSNSFSGKVAVSKPEIFPMIANKRSLLVASGSARGDEKDSPALFPLGAPITAGKKLDIVFDEFRAMNFWVRTKPVNGAMYGKGIIASISGADKRTITCLNADQNNAYYSAWAEIPLFELTTRVKFDNGPWEELPVRKLHPAWGAYFPEEVEAIPFSTIPGIIRSVISFMMSEPATFRSKEPAYIKLPLQIESIQVPEYAQTISVQSRLHSYFIAHYGAKFGGTPYVRENCTHLYQDGERVEREDFVDSPDFTPNTSWTFPIKKVIGDL